MLQSLVKGYGLSFIEFGRRGHRQWDSFQLCCLAVSGN